MAKITFLGTGGDAYVVGKQMRGAGGIIVEINGNQFHLDPGPGSLPIAKQCGINLRNTVGILVSHGHLNHCSDLNAVISAMTFAGYDRHGVLLGSESVINGTDDIDPALHQHFSTMVERAIPLQGVPRVGINRVDVVVTPTVHDDETAVGFKLVGEKETISYTGDTGISQEVIDAHKGASVLIVNMPLPKEERSQNNLNPVDVIKLAMEVKPKILVITHFGHDLLKQDVREVGRYISQESKIQTVVAEDGMILDSTTYK